MRSDYRSVRVLFVAFLAWSGCGSDDNAHSDTSAANATSVTGAAGSGAAAMTAASSPAQGASPSAATSGAGAANATSSRAPAPTQPTSMTPAAAGAAAPGMAAAGGVTYHKDIRPVIESNCLDCHIPGGIGPFALDTYAAVKQVGGAVVNAVKSGIMPPWPADPNCHPLRDDRSLKPETRDLFMAWQTANFQEGDRSAYVAPPKAATVDQGPPTLTLTPGGMYTPKPNADEYRCFVLKSFDKDTYLTGLGIEPSARAEVHHVQIHRVNSNQVSQIQNLDQQDSELGYLCMGSTGALSQNMFSYRPGSAPVQLDKGDGAFIPAGSMILIQVHYNTVFLPQGTQPTPDQTKVMLWTLPEGQIPEHIVYRTTVWGPSNIPANQKMTTTTMTPMRSLSSFDKTAQIGVSNGPFGLQQGVGAPAAPADAMFVPGEIVGLSPHAHQLAKKMTANLKASGKDTCLVNINWDFNWQLDYMFTQGVPYGPDDVITASCEYDNTAENQPVIDGVKQQPRNVSFGERSIDEMCQHYIWLRFERKAFLAARGLPAM